MTQVIMNWLHSVCNDCWNRMNNRLGPFRVKEEYVKEEPCCYCGEGHCSGIYVRADPQYLRCKGNHG